MSRIIGIVVVIVALFAAQQVHNFNLSRNYFEVEATLVQIAEDCYLENNEKEYFNCNQLPNTAAKSASQDNEIFRHANLTYSYQSPIDKAARQVGTQRWRVKPDTFHVGQTQSIFIKKDDPAKILWSKLVI